MNSLRVRYTLRQLHSLMMAFHEATESIVNRNHEPANDVALLVYLVLKELRMRMAIRVDSGKPVKSFTYNDKEVMAIHWAIRRNWVITNDSLTEVLLSELFNKIKTGYTV